MHRRFFGVVVIIIATVFSFLFTGQAKAVPTMTISDQSGAYGNTISVPVKASDFTSTVGGMTFDVLFNHAFVSSTVYTAGVLPGVGTFDFNNAVADTISVNWFTATPLNFSSLTTLFTLNFTVVTTTNTSTALSFAGAQEVADSVGDPIGSIGWTNGTLTLNPPSAPTATATISFASVSTSSLTVNWTDVSGATGYRLYENGSLATTTVVTTSDRTGLNTDTSYSYYVIAYNGTGDGPTSTVATTATSALPPPDAPATVTTTGAGTSNIGVAWADSSAGETGFEVSYSSNGSTFSVATTTAADVTSTNVASLQSNTGYWFRVRAMGSGSNSAYTTTTEATYTNAKDVPSVTATATTSITMSIQWSANDNPVGTGYQVYGTGNISTTTATSTGSTVTTTVTLPTPNTEYTVYVRTINQDGSFSASPQSVTAYAKSANPVSPTAYSVSTSTLTLVWGGSGNPTSTTDYYITGDNSFTPVTATATTTKQVTVAPNRTYHFNVRSINNDSSYNDLVAVGATTTLAVNVTSPLISAVSASTLTISWTDGVNTSTAYEVSGDHSFTSVTTTNLTKDLTGLTPSTTYTFTVKALNNNDGATYTSGVAADATTTLSANPTSPTASSISTSSLTLSWGANNNPGTVVYRIINDHDLSTTTLATSSSFTGLTPNTAYNYSVASKNFDDTYNAVVSSSVATTLATNPTAPTVSAVSTSTLTLSWGANGNPAGTTYRIIGTNGFATTTKTVTSTELTVSPNTSYTFTVASQNSGDSSYNSGVSATETTTLAAIPVTPSASANGQTSMIVSWSSDTNGSGTLYDLYNVTNATTTATVTGTSYTVTGLTADSSYQFKIRAQYQSDDTTWSSYSATSTGVSTAAVGASVSITLSIGGSSGFQLAGGESHTATLDSITDGEVTLSIASTPFSVYLHEGEHSDNAANGLTVTMGTVGASSAQFTITSYTAPVASTSGGGGGYYSIQAPSLSSFTINNGAKETNTRNVTLNLASSNGALMVISNSDYFDSTSYETFSTNKPWTLSPGNGLKTVYVRLRSAAGGEVVVSQSITLKGQTEEQTQVSLPSTTVTPVTQTVQEISVYIFTKNLSSGSKSEEVKQLQLRLQELGYLSKTVKTVTNFGPATKAAVIKLQKEHKLKADGVVNAAVRDILNGVQTESPVVQPVVSTNYVFSKNLSYGMRSDAVKQLQIKLQILGYLTATPNGVFGPATKAAVVKFQKDHDLKPYPGNVGPATRTVLNQI